MNETKQTAIRSLAVFANEWFDKSGGNSYHSADIFVNGKWLATLPFGYGYGGMYLQRAAEQLAAIGLLPEGNLYSTCHALGIDFYSWKKEAKKAELAKNASLNTNLLNELKAGQNV